MTTLLLIAASTVGVYYVSLRYLRSHPLTLPQSNAVLFAAFFGVAAACVWIGISIGRMWER